MKQVQVLLKNVWIEKCGGPWDSRIVLAEKPHQERIQNIDDLIWRMCISNRKLPNISSSLFQVMMMI